MYRTAYQRGFVTVFYSVGSKPLDMWEVHIKNGHIARLLDPDIKSMVLDIRGNNVSTSYILCPSNNRILGITMPFMVMVVKNLKKYFTFEVTILDDTGVRRRFRVSNFQSTTQIMPLSTVMPIGLADGWNQIQFNLSEFTRRAYNKTFVEVQKIKVNANIRLRRIYFADKLAAEEDLPPEYRIFLPIPSKVGKGKKTTEPEEKETIVIKPSSQQAVTAQSQRNLKTASMTSIVDIPQTTLPPEVVPPGGEEEPPPPSPHTEVGTTGGQEESPPPTPPLEVGPPGGEEESPPPQPPPGVVLPEGEEESPPPLPPSEASPPAEEPLETAAVDAPTTTEGEATDLPATAADEVALTD